MTLIHTNPKTWFTRAFLVFITLCPIAWLAKGNFGMATMRVDQAQVFQIGAVIFTAIFLIENVYLSLFLLLSVANFISHNFCGSEYLLNILMGCLIYQVTYKISDDSVIHGIFSAILWLCAINLLWDFGNRYNFELLFRNFSDGQYGSMRGVGLMGLKCFYGMIFAMALPFLLYRDSKIWPLFFVPMWLSESSVAIVGGIFAVLFHFWYESKRIFFGLLVICLIAGGWYVAQDSKAGMFSDRASVWKISLRDSVKKPFMGYGLDSFRNINLEKGGKDWLYAKLPETGESFHMVVVPETGQVIIPKNIQADMKRLNAHTVDPWDHPHNEYVMLVFTYGLPGLILLIFFIKDIFARFDSYDSRQIAIIASLGVYAIISIGQFPFHVVRLGLFIPILLGMYYNLTDKEYEIA